MATVFPPPSKRQRREGLQRTQVQQDVSATNGPAGSFKALFLDGDGKQVTDNVVEVPLADASEKNLSLLVNTLLARVRNGRYLFVHDNDGLTMWHRIEKIFSRIDFAFTFPIPTLLWINIPTTFCSFCAAMA